MRARNGHASRSLRRALQPWLRRLAWSHATTRALIGTALLVAPSKTARPWLGSGVDRGGGQVALQAFAIRDAALGVGILHSLAKGQPVRHWFRLGLSLELVDSGATFLHRRELPDSPVPDAWALLGLAGLVGGAAVAFLLDE